MFEMWLSLVGQKVKIISPNIRLHLDLKRTMVMTQSDNMSSDTRTIWPWLIMLHLSLLSMNSLNKTLAAMFTLLLHLLLPGIISVSFSSTFINDRVNNQESNYFYYRKPVITKNDTMNSETRTSDSGFQLRFLHQSQMKELIIRKVITLKPLKTEPLNTGILRKPNKLFSPENFVFRSI